MASQAHAEYDIMRGGVRIMVRRAVEGGHVLFRWPEPVMQFVLADGHGSSVDQADEHEAWLRLGEDDARAVYEELADYFGHAGHDIRALRKDYDSERTRVDRLITFITGGAR